MKLATRLFTEIRPQSTPLTRESAAPQSAPSTAPSNRATLRELLSSRSELFNGWSDIVGGRPARQASKNQVYIDSVGVFENPFTHFGTDRNRDGKLSFNEAEAYRSPNGRVGETDAALNLLAGISDRLGDRDQGLFTRRDISFINNLLKDGKSPEDVQKDTVKRLRDRQTYNESLAHYDSPLAFRRGDSNRDGKLSFTEAENFLHPNTSGGKSDAALNLMAGIADQLGGREKGLFTQKDIKEIRGLLDRGLTAEEVQNEIVERKRNARPQTWLRPFVR